LKFINEARGRLAQDYVETILSEFVFSCEMLTSMTTHSFLVPGMILWRNLHGAMRLDCSKNMSVHIQLAPVTISTH